MTPWGRLINEYERELVRLFRRFQTGPLTDGRLRLIADSRDFRSAVDAVARRMVGKVVVTNAASWREAAARGTRSREIFEALRKELNTTGERSAVERMVTANAAQIRSIPLDVAQRLTNFAATKQKEGKRSAEVEKEIRRLIPHLTANKIKLIARTEIGRSEAALTQVRAEELDIHWFQWSTSEDQRVRASHRNLDKVLMSWADLPQPEELIGERSTLGRGAPGAFPNCRCVGLPIVSLDQITWPARVYQHRRIRFINRDRFALDRADAVRSLGKRDTGGLKKENEI